MRLGKCRIEQKTANKNGDDFAETAHLIPCGKTVVAMHRPSRNGSPNMVHSDEGTKSPKGKICPAVHSLGPYLWPRLLKDRRALCAARRRPHVAKSQVAGKARAPAPLAP